MKMNFLKAKIIVFLVTGCLLLFVGQTYADWSARTPLSTPRDQHTGGVIDGKIYVFGGNGNPDGINLKSTEKFDPETNIWTYRADNENNSGYGVEEVTGAAVSGKLYVFGAWGGGSPYGVFNFVEEYDPGSDTWTSKAPMPTTRASATAAVYDGEIYVFGGYYSYDGGPHTNYSVVEAYNPLTNTWRYVTDMPRTSQSSAIAVEGQRAYVIGGYSHDEARMLDDVIVYDFQTDEWITEGFSPLSNPRAFAYGSAAPVVDGKMYLIGGWEGTMESSWATDKVEIYDIAANSWSTGPALPQPMGNDLSLVLNNTIYVIGGELSEDIRTGAVWISEIQPIPEPTTFLLLGTGLLSLVGYVRRKVGRR